MGGLTSLLNKQPAPYGINLKSTKGAYNQWPHFFSQQVIPSSFHNSITLFPDMNGKWFDNSSLKIPLNSGFAMSLNCKLTSPNSALAKSVVMKGEELPMPVPADDECCNKDMSNSPPIPVSMPQFENDLKYDLFGLICGHEDIRIGHFVDYMLLDKIHDKISEVKSELSFSFRNSSECILLKHEPFACCQTERILVEEVIIGALEQSFYEVDTLIGNRWHDLGFTGGCSLIVCIIINNCLYIANAGKCRAYLHSPNKPCVQITTDCTPDYDRQRIQSISYLQPQLLTPEYTRLQFEITLRDEHKGQKVLYRDKHMTGWAFKQVTDEDIYKVPSITGVGDKSRLFGLDIPSRGIGFYSQKAPGCIPFKPFITCIPEITSMSLADLSKGDSLVLTSPDCSKYITPEAIEGVMNKGLGNGTDPRSQDTGPSQAQAFNILSLTNQIANSSNLERHIVNVDDHLLDNSRNCAHDLALACMVIPLKK
ncbi:Protein phosphatase 1H-like isoform X1 [Oopsacas minuta]|uniref:Protein phosphatase 1H-like isoform X1 n=1 Tax=Oopsacas minuta TaxID=111878 RepID=A0AAV7JD40_9METZ|nr:Protein phosphatase 1H-like isoform X1 [Oopsacas minuta]